MKSINYIPQEGVDKGKIFVITRMSAFQADQWARRIMTSLIKQGLENGENLAELGMMGLSTIAFNLFGGADKDVTEESLKELLSCVKIIRDPRNPSIAPMEIMEEDFEDPTTLQNIYLEAFKLNLDFLKAAASVILPLAAAIIPPEPTEE